MRMTQKERDDFVDMYGTNIPGALYNIGDHVRYYRDGMMESGIVEAVVSHRPFFWWPRVEYFYLLQGQYVVHAQAALYFWDN